MNPSGSVDLSHLLNKPYPCSTSERLDPPAATTPGLLHSALSAHATAGLVEAAHASTAIGTSRAEVPMQATLSIPRELTVEGLLSLPTDHRYELREGNLYVKAPETVWHTRVSRRLANALEAAGQSVAQEVGIKFGRCDSRTPDLAVFKDKPDDDRAFFWPHEIQAAIEIVSPSSMDDDRLYKPLHYARARIPEFWRIERAPDDRTDAVILKHHLTPTAHATPAYVHTDVLRLSDLEPTTPP